MNHILWRRTQGGTEGTDHTLFGANADWMSELICLQVL
jgi:hypothetical protein